MKKCKECQKHTQNGAKRLLFLFSVSKKVFPAVTPWERERREFLLRALKREGQVARGLSIRAVPGTALGKATFYVTKHFHSRS